MVMVGGGHRRSNLTRGSNRRRYEDDYEVDEEGGTRVQKVHGVANKMSE